MSVDYGSGSEFTDLVWDAADEVPTLPPEEWRLDGSGNLIARSAFNDRSSDFGWFVGVTARSSRVKSFCTLYGNHRSTDRSAVARGIRLPAAPFEISST